MTHDPKFVPSSDADEAIDATVRRALEPPPAAIDRVVRHALDGRSSVSTPHPGRRWATGGLALVASVILVSLLAIPPRTTVDPVAPPITPADADEPEAVLSISNLSGSLTVTTAAGTQWILLSGDTP